MDFYPESYNVTIAVPFTDPTGTAETPASASAKLLDADGVDVQDLGAISYAADATSVDVLIPGAYNVVPEGAQRTVFILAVTMELAGGTITRNHSYVVERPVLLETMTNSFMTLERASLLAMEFANITAWAASDDTDRRVALTEAFRRITRMPMRFTPIDTDLTDEVYIERQDWPGLTVADFNAWPEHFQGALRRAQIIEADEILQGDSLSRLRRAGVVSETIGESAMKFGEGIVDYGVGTETMAALAGYVHYNFRIGRA